MGLSSSQARLLSLTARMHDIEYKAARLEAQKLQMANKSTRVYEDYLLALDQTKIMAKVLSTDGSFTNIDFTAARIYNYNELLDQYALVTMDGKTLIPESLHNTYENTDSLFDFLNAYGLISTYTQTVYHPTGNPDYVSAEEQYEIDHKQWESDYNDYEEWLAEKPDKSDQTQAWWTTIPEDVDIGELWKEAGGACYTAAQSGTISCYAHILAHIIDYYDGTGYDGSSSNYSNSSWYDGVNNVYTTSLGNSVTVSNSDVTNSNLKDATKSATMAEVSSLISDGILTAVASGEYDLDENSTDFEKLISIWNYDEVDDDGNHTTKSIKQWAIDLYYVCKNSSSIDGYNKNELLGTITTFQDGLSNLVSGFNQDVYNAAYEEWLAKEPKETTLEDEPQKSDYVGEIPEDYNEIIEHTTINNKDLAQWYINLWYKMEGEDEVPAIQEEVIYDDATQSYVTLYSVDNKTKSETTYSTNSDWNTTENENYIVITDDYLNDPTWVTNAVQAGAVMIQIYDSKQSKFIDTSAAVDTMLVEVQDETLLKKAEAKYEADMKKIDLKDRKYDTDLAAIETEREAIKDEIDTLKTVAKDNVERTFKLFA